MNEQPWQLPLALSIPAVFDADDLVITNSNRAAFALVEQWPNWPLPIALLIGPEGSGKTHFSKVWQKKSGALQSHLTNISAAIDAASQGQSILLEDIFYKYIDETSLFHLINSVRQAQSFKPNVTLLMTATTPPKEWGLKLQDLISRLKSVMFVTLDQPDDELLAAVLTKLFSDRQIDVDPSVINFIISRMERSLSAARTLVQRADDAALGHKVKIGRQLIKDVLSQLQKDNNQLS